MNIPKQPTEDREVLTDGDGNPICSLPKGITSTPGSPWYSRLVAILILGNYTDSLISIGNKFIQIYKDIDHAKIQGLSSIIDDKIRELKIHEYVGVKDPASLKKKYELYAQLENYLEQLRTKYQS